MKLRIKYCGGCNPIIDRKKVVDEVTDAIKATTSLELTEDEAEVAMVVCGCPVACVDIDNIKSHVKKLVLVAGDNVNYRHVPRDQMAKEICQLILEGKEEK